MLTVDNINAIEEKNKFSYAFIYPNPFRNGFYIKLNENESIEKLTIIGQTGEFFINPNPSTFPYFDVSFISSGFYLLKIQTNKQSIFLRIVKR